MRGTLSGPTTAWDTKMDTRGTQTDLVTDRNIVDCLMELKSSAEFQDLTYRFNRSCTGEMTLIITRENSAGLLGIPFDPVSATITAGGFCYLSALFTPVEITDLKSGGSGSSVCLRKFRHILWKLNGRAGYGFCPGFTEDHFPAGFRFKSHNLEVLRQPFTRIQSKGCPVFLQLRRTSSRASAQPLGIQVCSACLKALTDLYAKLKSSGEDLSRVPAFAVFLPANSHPVDTMLINSKFRKEKLEVFEEPKHSSSFKTEEEMLASVKSKPNTEIKEEGVLKKTDVNPLVTDACVTNKEEQDGHFNMDTSSLSVANECEVMTDTNSMDKAENGKLMQKIVPVKECSVLLDRLIPGVSSTSKEDTPAVSAPDDTSTSYPRSEALSAGQLPVCLPPVSSLHASSQSSTLPLTSSCSPPTAPSSTKQRKSMSAKGELSRPVLSARIKPFRTAVPEGGEHADSSVFEGTDVTTRHHMLHRQHTGRQEKADTSPDTGPPVLTPEMDLSPGNSPQPLLIDEDADPDELGSAAVDEPDPKRPCHRCEFCQEGFQSETELHLHFSQHHQHDHTTTTTVTPGNIPTSASDTVISDLAGQQQQLTEQQKTQQQLIADQQLLAAQQKEHELSGDHQHQPQQQLMDKEGLRWKVCPVCHSAYVSKGEFEAHMMERHGARLHGCRYCGEKFALKKNLADHLQRHQGAKKLVCKDCGAKFTKKKEFASHVRQHMGSLPYFCTICSKFFSRESVYEEHLERHRAKRGVRAVLTGKQKTLQGVLTKARRCLEEKVVMSPLASSITKETPSSIALGVVTNSASLPSSLSVPNSEPPPSNLYLLSAVSLARAELDRQPGDLDRKPSTSEESSVNLSESNATAAAQLLQLSTGEQGTTILGNSQSPAAALEKKHQSVEDIRQAPVTETSSKPHNEGTASSLLSASGNSFMQAVGSNEHDQVLIDKELKLQQKEQELEQERSILRKKMMMCHQLFLAQLYAQQQSKAHNGGPAVSVSGGQADSGGDTKPSSRQILMMLAALRKNFTGARTNNSSKAAVRPPTLEPNVHGSATPFSSFPKSGSRKVVADLGNTVASGNTPPLVPQTKTSLAGVNPHQPCLPHTQTSAAGGTPSRQNPLHTPLRASLSVATLSSQNSAVMANHPTLPPSHQAPYQKGGSFLEDLMKLQSVMPAKVKEFLPKTALSKAVTSIPTPSPIGSNLGLVSKPSAILCKKLSESLSKAATDKGKGRSPRGKAGGRTTDTAQKKLDGWSGGQFKEKMNQVVTVVPPQEMSRLLSLTSGTPLSALPSSLGSASPTSSPSVSPDKPSSVSQANNADPSPRIRSQQVPEVNPPSESPAYQVTPANGTSCSSAPEIFSSHLPQDQTTRVPPSGSPGSPLLPSSQSSAPPPSSHYSQPGSSAGQSSSLPQAPNCPSFDSSHIPSSSPRAHSQAQPPLLAGPRSSAGHVPHGPSVASPATQVPFPQPLNGSPASQIHPSTHQPCPQASQILSPLQSHRFPLGSPSASQAPAAVHHAPGHVEPLINQSAPRLCPPLPSTLCPAGPGPLLVPCSIDEVPAPAAEVQIVAEEIGPIDLTKGSKRLMSEEGIEPPLDPNHNKSVSLRHVLLEPPAAHARQKILAGEVPVAKDRPASQPQVDLVLPPQGINPQIFYARIRASVQAAPDSPAAQALLRQLSCLSNGGSPRFPVPPAAQGLPPGMPPLIRGNIAPAQQRAKSSSPDRGPLLRSPIPVSSPPKCVAPPSQTGSASLSVSSSEPSPAVSISSLSPGAMPAHSQTGAVCIVTRRGSSSALSTPSTTSSPLQMSMSPPLHQQAATRYHLSSPPESNDSARRFPHNAGARPEEDRGKAAVNPLGGFAWHRPATVDPFMTAQKETNSSAAHPVETAGRSGKNEASKGGRKKQADIEDLRDDQNLWQQQFLQTLREKRKHNQELQERQLQVQQQEQQWQQEQERLRHQLDQPQCQPNASSSRGGEKCRTPQRRRPRKRDANDDIEPREAINSTSGSDLQGTSNSQSMMSPVQETEAYPTARKAARPKKTGPRVRGRGKGRHRKTPTPPPLSEMVEATVSVPQVVIEEEGAEFGYVTELGVKVEPLVAGVSCDACRKVLYSETEILEHECDELKGTN